MCCFCAPSLTRAASCCVLWWHFCGVWMNCWMLAQTFALLLFNAAKSLCLLLLTPVLFCTILCSWVLKSKHLKDREDALGWIIKCDKIMDQCGTSYHYDAKWILWGMLLACDWEDLLWSSAEREGMTDDTGCRRNKCKPVDIVIRIHLSTARSKQVNAASAISHFWQSAISFIE